LDKVVVVVKGRPIVFTGHKLKVSNSRGDVGTITSMEVHKDPLLWVIDEEYKGTTTSKQLGVFTSWDYWKIIEDKDYSMLRPILVPPEKSPPRTAVIRETLRAWRAGTLDILPAGWTIINPYC